MKQTLSSEDVAKRMAQELRDGDVVNLGVGLPSLVSSFIPKQISVILHVENGIIGFGRVLNTEEHEQMDYNLVNAGAQFVAPIPGMCIVDFAESFDALRTGRVNVTMLGAYEVSGQGDLASWTLASLEKLEPSKLTLGGAMDMTFGAKRIIVGMKHQDKFGRPRIVEHCSLPLTAKHCVNLIVTDVAVISVGPDGLELLEVAPGWTAEEVQAITESKLHMPQELSTMLSF